ncbi:MAG: hypothetical protein HQK50_08040 [Oligoflexia bacterium]|nr:hypothetical protein [Oligoflexia bacterium]
MENFFRAVDIYNRAYHLSIMKLEQKKFFIYSCLLFGLMVVVINVQSDELSDPQNALSSLSPLSSSSLSSVATKSGADCFKVDCLHAKGEPLLFAITNKVSFNSERPLRSLRNVHPGVLIRAPPIS